MTTNRQSQQGYDSRQQQREHYDENDEYQIGNQKKNVQGFHELPVQESESDDGDVLEKIDTLLHNGNRKAEQEQDNRVQRKMTQKQMLLQFKINELQKIIYNLNEANKKLNKKLQQYYSSEPQRQSTSRNNESSSNMNNNSLSSESNVPYNDELTQMQGEFQQIEGLIQEYKEQLAAAEGRWNLLKEEKDEEIQSLKRELVVVTEGKEQVEVEMQKTLQQNQQLQQKNQQLLIQLQTLQTQLQQRTQSLQSQPITYPSRQYYETPSRNQFQMQDYRFNQRIEKQMQVMIKKLLKELANERKINSKMSFEIKRLGNEVIELERKIKQKNDTIYQLQMKLIMLEKHGRRLVPNNLSGRYNTNANQRSQKVVVPLTPNTRKNQLNTATNITRQNYPNPRTIFTTQRNQPQAQDYPQYQEETYDNNQYQDYVMTSLQQKGNQRSPRNNNNKNTGISNGNMIKNQITAKRGQQSNFIKPKQRIQTNSNNISKPQQPEQTLTSNNLGNKGTNSPSNPSRQFISFTLMQLQEGRLKITIKQKIIIISRLIELYCKKIKTKNYYNLIAEEIQVYNFSDKHPNLIRVRIVEANATHSRSDISSTLQQDTEESLLYNLAFIVENLVKECDTVDRQDVEVDLNLTQIIEEILGKTLDEKINYFKELSKSLQASVNTLQ